MSVGIKATFNPLVKRPIGRFISRFHEETVSVFEDVYPPIRQEMLVDLRYIPNRRFWTQEDWASRKQQIAFHATNGFGGGIPHQRSGRLPAGWQVDAQVTGTTISAEVKNTEPGAPYVYGSLSKANPGKYQARGHIKTGWPQGYEVVTFWLNALKEDVLAALRERFGDAVAGIGTKQRAFTRTRRR
jgi:hypothetical protein